MSAPPLQIIHTQTSEDDRYIYGDTFEGSVQIGSWMKPKFDHWTSDTFENII